jgi:hypothetical protein
MRSTRREFMYGSALGLLGIAADTQSFAKASVPAARANAFTPSEAAVLDALGEVMLPGARQAGISGYVGTQLLLPPEHQVLMIKYIVSSPPYTEFYRSGLNSLEAVTIARYSRHFFRLPPAQAAGLLQQLGAGKLEHWSGPPQPLFHFIARNDALDVVYGTKRGFNELGTPYMAHIEPPEDWPQ